MVKRMDFIFGDQECQILNFTDLTSYAQLYKEKTKNKLLRALNASIHHELLTPLIVMIEICKRLLQSGNRP